MTCPVCRGTFVMPLLAVPAPQPLPRPDARSFESLDEFDSSDEKRVAPRKRRLWPWLSGGATLVLVAAVAILVLIERKGGNGPLKVLSAARAMAIMNSMGQNEREAEGSNVWLILEIEGLSKEAFDRIPEDRRYVTAGQGRCEIYLFQFNSTHNGLSWSHRIIAYLIVPNAARDMSLTLGDFPPVPFRAEEKVTSRHRMTHN